MSMRRMSAAIAVGIGLLAAHADAAPRAAAQRQPVLVDVTRLRALGLGPTADLVQAAMLDELASHGVAPKAGGRLVIHVIGLSLNAYAGSEGSDGGGGGGGSGGGGSGGTNYDYLEGEALVLGPGGEVLDRFPQVLALPSNSGGAYYLPGAEQRRVRVLSGYFVEWIRRRLG